MAACRGCGKAFRKGRRRAVLNDDGSVTVGLVCGDCAARAFAIIRPIGDAASVCRTCKKAPARICVACSTRARAEVVAPVLAQLHSMALAFETVQTPGGIDKAEALRSAMRALQVETERA